MSVVTFESTRPHNVKGVLVSFVIMSAFSLFDAYNVKKILDQVQKLVHGNI